LVEDSQPPVAGFPVIDRIYGLMTQPKGYIQHGNVIAADFRPTGVSLGLAVGVDTIYADDNIVVLRCTVGGQVWHMLGDIATGNVIST
jgi:hypothetical protein